MTEQDGSHAGDQQLLEEVRAFLLSRGVSDEQITRAHERGQLDVLVADYLLLPGPARYDEEQVCEMTGVSVDVARRLWRALGFPDPRPGEAMFTDLDIEAIRNLQSMMELGVGNVDTFVQLGRVLGSSMARVAEAEVSPSMLGVLPLAPSSDSLKSAHRLATVAEQVLPATADLVVFAWRRHVQAALRRAAAFRAQGDPDLPRLCVGFADMVGFTMLSQEMSQDELATLVSRFEELAHEVVTSRNGRVVKMIGDEAMFVSESTLDAADIGLALADAYSDDELLSDVRVSLAVGPVLVQDGDYYGPVVNLANRVASIAHPGTVLVTDEFRDALLAEVDDKGDATGENSFPFVFTRLRSRSVKDLGRLQLWSLRRLGEEPPSLERRLSRRWERFSDVLRDLEELRDRGEQLVSGRLRPPGDPDSEASEGGDPPGAKLEAAVERRERPSSEVDEPT